MAAIYLLQENKREKKPEISKIRDGLYGHPIPGMVGGGLHSQSAGCWSDDSSMPLCLADSIDEVGSLINNMVLSSINTASVGNGLAHSVGEAALEPGLNMRKWGKSAYSTMLFPVGCTNCRFAVGMSKPIPYGHQ